MTAQARVPATGSNLPPGTLTRIANGYSRSTLYKTIESAAKMLGSTSSVWHDQLVLIVAYVPFHIPDYGSVWFALVIVDSKVGWVYAVDLRPGDV